MLEDVNDIVADDSIPLRFIRCSPCQSEISGGHLSCHDIVWSSRWNCNAVCVCVCVCVCVGACE